MEVWNYEGKTEYNILAYFYKNIQAYWAGYVINFMDLSMNVYVYWILDEFQDFTIHCCICLYYIYEMASKLHFNAEVNFLA